MTREEAIAIVKKIRDICADSYYCDECPLSNEDLCFINTRENDAPEDWEIRDK